MRYYSNPAAAFDTVADWLPASILHGEQLAAAVDYFSRLPQEFVASAFGFEIFLQIERVDIGFSHPLNMGRATLLPALLRQLEERSGQASPGWKELRRIAERTAALPGTKGLKGLSVGVGGPHLSGLGGPGLVYLSFIRRALIGPNHSFASRNIGDVIGALLPAAPRSETAVLSMLERLRRRSHQVVQVGVSLGKQPGRLRFFLAGTIRDHLKLLDTLGASQRKGAKLLSALVDRWADWRAGILLRLSEGRIGRLDVEIYPAKDRANGGPSPVQSACDTALCRDLVSQARRSALSSMAEHGTHRVSQSGIVPVSIRLNHIKFSEREEDGDCQWKAYVACRQEAGAAPATHLGSPS